MKDLLSLHKLVTLEVLVSLVGTTNAGTVDTPAHVSVVALLGLEFAVVLTLRVIDSIIVYKGSLHWLSPCSGVQALFGSVHLSFHQEALGDH